MIRRFEENDSAITQTEKLNQIVNFLSFDYKPVEEQANEIINKYKKNIEGSISQGEKMVSEAINRCEVKIKEINKLEYKINEKINATLNSLNTKVDKLLNEKIAEIDSNLNEAENKIQNLIIKNKQVKETKTTEYNNFINSVIQSLENMKRK